MARFMVRNRRDRRPLRGASAGAAEEEDTVAGAAKQAQVQECQHTVFDRAAVRNVGNRALLAAMDGALLVRRLRVDNAEAPAAGQGAVAENIPVVTVG